MNTVEKSISSVGGEMIRGKTNGSVALVTAGHHTQMQQSKTRRLQVETIQNEPKQSR